MDVGQIKAKLATLSNQEWPDEWDAKAGETNGDYLGWCHRYRLNEPISDDDIARFEQDYGVSLPEDYAFYLRNIGNGGPGPGFGICPLGEGEDGGLPEEMLEALPQDFAHTGPWNDTSLRMPDAGDEFIPHEDYYAYSVIAGSLEIATDGCALYYLLVLSGPARGQIWYDKRTEAAGIAPVLDESGNVMTFRPWFENWLDSAFARLAAR